MASELTIRQVYDSYNAEQRTMVEGLVQDINVFGKTIPGFSSDRVGHVKRVMATMSETQKQTMYFLIGEALERKK